MSAPGGTRHPAEPTPRSFRRDADALLALHADILDDLERVRIANENRLRALTSATVTGERGGTFGKNVNPWLPEVAAVEALLDTLRAAEHGAELHLKRAMRAHPLGAWVKRTVGVGEKQAARLLAAIGDPADRSNIAKLWAYCGLHVHEVRDGQPRCDAQTGRAVPDPNVRGDQEAHDAHRVVVASDATDRSGQRASDAHRSVAAAVSSPASHRSHDAHSADAGGHQDGSGHRSGDAHRSAAAASDPGDQEPCEAQGLTVAGVAPTRTRGQKSNWSTLAKTRAYLVAESCIKQRTSPYRAVYDAGRAKYADAVHPVACVRCGPQGSPAPAGSPLSLGHQHARAIRLVMKAILRDLWVEARAARANGVPKPNPATPVPPASPPAPASEEVPAAS